MHRMERRDALASLETLESETYVETSDVEIAKIRPQPVNNKKFTRKLAPTEIYSEENR